MQNKVETKKCAKKSKKNTFKTKKNMLFSFFLFFFFLSFASFFFFIFFFFVTINLLRKTFKAKPFTEKGYAMHCPFGAMQRKDTKTKIARKKIRAIIVLTKIARIFFRATKKVFRLSCLFSKTFFGFL